MSKVDFGIKRNSSRIVEIDGTSGTPEIIGNGLKFNYSTDTSEGVVRFDTSSKKIQYHNGTNWVDCGATYGGGGAAYDDFVSDPLDSFVYAFSDLEVLANYTAFASDPTEVHGFDTEAQP